MTDLNQKAEKMNTGNLQDKIIEAIISQEKKLKIDLQNGDSTLLHAITFSQLIKSLGVINKNIEEMRVIKRKLKDLIESDVVIEIDSEPAFYLLCEEFAEKIGTKSNISGVEGFC